MNKELQEWQPDAKPHQVGLKPVKAVEFIADLLPQTTCEPRSEHKSAWIIRNESGRFFDFNGGVDWVLSSGDALQFARFKDAARIAKGMGNVKIVPT